MKRYGIHQFNRPDNFVVQDEQSAWFSIMNDQAQIADNTDPAQMRFFGMPLADAQALADALNAC